MTTIISEGDLPQNENGIFRSTRFWISSSTPSRTHFANIIKSNGGTITITERDADICIVDHAREIPQVSDRVMCSYKFVEDSVKRGEMAAIEDHAVKPKGPEKKSRSVTRWRTHFTEAEDITLMIKLSEVNQSLSGNKVYQELANNYPAHTMHSWRGRWVNVYSPRNNNPHFWLKKLRTKSGGEGREKNVGSSKIDLTPTTRFKEFSRHDDKLLQRFHCTLTNFADDDEKTAAWIKFGEKNPFYNIKQWRERYKQLLPEFKRTIGQSIISEPYIKDERSEAQKSSIKKQTQASNTNFTSHGTPGLLSNGFSSIEKGANPRHLNSKMKAERSILQTPLSESLPSIKQEEPSQTIPIWAAAVHQHLSTPTKFEMSCAVNKRKYMSASSTVSCYSPCAEIPPSPEADMSLNYYSRELSPEIGTNIIPSSLSKRCKLTPDPENNFDLTIPPIPSSPTGCSLPPAVAIEELAELEELKRFLPAMQEKYKCDLEKVVWALVRTSASKRLIEVVLEADMRGNGLPDLPGVWSEKDDRILAGSDSKDIEKLSRTKGDWNERLEFLGKWNAA